MNEISFSVASGPLDVGDTAYVDDEVDDILGLVGSAITAISSEVTITAGGITMTLGAWSDPDHWSDDWAEIAGEEANEDDFDPCVYVAGLIASDG